MQGLNLATLRALGRFSSILNIFIKFHLDELIDEFDPNNRSKIFLFLIPRRWFRRKMNLPRGERIRLALEELGPLYIKFGQSLSTRPDLLPEDIAKELSKLQDDVPPFSGDLVLEIMHESYPDGINSVFSQFDSNALASASVAQAHAATLISGEEVIVKIIRPNIWDQIKEDMNILFLIANLLNKFTIAKKLRPMEVVEDYQKTVLHELDLMREAANCSQIGRNWAGSEIIKVPQIHWDLCRRNVLVQERIHGIPIDNIEKLKEFGVNFERLAKNGVRIFFTQVFHHNLFHADMHPGNVFVDVTDPNNPKYAAVDFGIVGSLDEKDREYLAKSFNAFFEKDYGQIANNFISAGWVPEETKANEFESAIRTVCDPIADKPLEDISFGQLLFRLFETARDFNMVNQPQLIQLEKTLLNIEGLGRQLYPKLDLVSSAKPVMEEWRREQLSITNTFKKIHKDLPEIKKTIELIPPLMRKILEDEESKKNMPQPDLSYFVRQLYMGIIGVGFLIVGAIMLGFNQLASFSIIVIGLIVLLTSKPKH
ncbi:MAG: 2-polyprenylphenol 6-hydroxylase [Gammaproteobacteria bacterium]|nr:MAG: 2-polyprenylphenol 6-hydroxylase [Gammaproteobacteria bacterium]